MMGRAHQVIEYEAKYSIPDPIPAGRDFAFIETDESAELIHIQTGHLIGVAHLEWLQTILHDLKQKSPYKKVTLIIDAPCPPSSVKKLISLIQRGDYPSRMTIDLSDLFFITAPRNRKKAAEKLIRAFTQSTATSLHLTISRSILSVLQNDFYKLLRQGFCLESLYLKAPSEMKNDRDAYKELQILSPSKLKGALRANTHLLNLKIDDFYYSTSPPSPDLFSSTVPNYFDHEMKDDLDCPRLLARNKEFIKAKKACIEEFFQTQAGWATGVIDLISDYADYMNYPSSAFENHSMVATALQEFTSLKSIKQNGFATFCTIYLRYKPFCREAFEKDQQCLSVLRQYMRHFFYELEQTYIACITTYENFMDFMDDLGYFIRLAGITQAELERQIAFVSSLRDEDIEILSRACIDYGKVDRLSVTIKVDSDFKEILSLRPGSTVLLKEFTDKDRKSSHYGTYFDQYLTERFCKVLADEKCPQNLTIVISKEVSHLILIHALTRAIREGAYPKGTCLIYKKADPFYLGYADLFRVLANKRTAKNPELHLVVPIFDICRTDFYNRAEIFPCIVHNKFLKTLILSSYDVEPMDSDPLAPEALINALKINDTLTTFDMNIELQQAIDYTFPVIRNQRFITEQCAVSHYRMPVILSQELRLPDFNIWLFRLAIDRYDGNLPVLFNGTFLDFFKKNILQIMELYFIFTHNHNYHWRYYDIKKIELAILPAAKITRSDVEEDTFKCRISPYTDVSMKSFLLDFLPKNVPSPLQPIVLLETEEEGLSFFKQASFVNATVRYYNVPELIPQIQENNPGAFLQAIKNLFTQRRLTLEQALQVSLLLKETKEDRPIDDLDREIKHYENNKGRFRKFFNTRTTTVRDLQALSTLLKNIGQPTVSPFQIELCLMARDQRTSCFQFRSGIINQSVTFFKTGDFAQSRKRSCRSLGLEALSQTEQLIHRLWNNCKTADELNNGPHL